MRATLHISLLAATLSPSLVHSSPIPFAQNYNSSPRSSAQALSDSNRPGGVLSSRSPLTHGGSRGYGLGLFDSGSSNAGNGGDASSGSSYAQGGDYHDKEDDHPTNDQNAPPTINLGPINQSGDQPQPEPAGNDTDQKPGVHDPGSPTPPPKEPEGDMNHNVVDDGSNNNPGPATAPPKPGSGPGAGENASDIPIFLGPSNVDPPPGSGGAPSDAPQKSGYRGDGGKHKYPDKIYDYPETSCGDHFSEPLINLLSGNGGYGGDASSGAATSLGYGGYGNSSAYSGAGGDASGGSVYAAPALINILSDNAGDGGTAKSGDSYSKRHGSASYSGPGGNASGGSVKNKNLCTKRRAVPQTLADSGTSSSVPTRSRSGGSLLALQRKWDNPPAAYSGKGGNAPGGNVEGDHALINVWSGNGGDGGDASSGAAYSYGPGAKAYSGAGGNAAGGDVAVGRRAFIDVRTSGWTLYSRFSPRENYGPTHPGAGKYPTSESKNHDRDVLVNAGSGNGGDGGYAQSGDAYAYGRGASAYSGPGGNASGGSVNGGRYDKAGKRDGSEEMKSGAEAYTGAGGDASGGSAEGEGGLIGLINLFTGNGGDGGDASSGSAFAYGKSAKAYSGPGGNASGGSVKDERYKKPGYGYKYKFGGLADVASGNGGDGGYANSGDAAVADG